MPTLALLATAAAAMLADPDPDPALAAAAQAHLAGMDDCGSTVAGRLSAEIAVQSGAVVAVQLVEGSLEPAEQRCVLGSLFSWQFTPQTSRTFTVTLDFTPIPPLSETDVAVVGRVVRSNAGQLRRCYEVALNTDPALSGQLEATVGIVDGQVRRLTLHGGLSEGLSTCIDRRMRSWQFPETVSGEVVLPLSFARPTAG